MNRKLLTIGVVGTIVTALCCFTSILVSLLAIAGLSALTGWLDVILLPLLGLFIILTIYALIKRKST